MRKQIANCSVIEIVENQDGELEPQDVLPWGDPYISRLLAKHRLESALSDSIDFLRNSAVIGDRPATRLPPEQRPERHDQPPTNG